MKHLKSIGLVLASLLLATTLLPPLSAAEAKQQPLELASPFVDDAVLQRGMPLPVWGWAAPAGEGAVLIRPAHCQAGQWDHRAADGKPAQGRDGRVAQESGCDCKTLGTEAKKIK